MLGLVAIQSCQYIPKNSFSADGFLLVQDVLQAWTRPQPILFQNTVTVFKVKESERYPTKQNSPAE